jgi:hypothetical protein
MHRDTVNNRPVLLVVAAMAVVLGGCAYNTAVKRDIHSQFYEIRPGSKLILHRALDIPSGKAHVTFGAGYYEGNCEFEVRTLGPGTVQPDTFIITRAWRDREWISHPNIMRFYRVMRLQSERQPDVLQLICQDWDGPLLGRDISVAEMRTALGDTFSFEFVP